MLAKTEESSCPAMKTQSLNLIKTPLYPEGTNTLVASGDTTVTLSIEWHEIDPHHQYQKYVYIIDTANWEEI